MNYQTTRGDKLLPTMSEDAAIEYLGLNSDYQGAGEYWAWPEVFGSTAGPFGGIGGQAMSTFTMEAWVFNGVAAKFCQGKVIRVARCTSKNKAYPMWFMRP